MSVFNEDIIPNRLNGTLEPIKAFENVYQSVTRGIFCKTSNNRTIGHFEQGTGCTIIRLLLVHEAPANVRRPYTAGAVRAAGEHNARKTPNAASNLKHIRDR